ncbi:cuticle protein AMP2-like [Macrobrachium nipponense]|uniref:cuticle protein AMP2-like n=1 Tax=Macrobrachium nipponense TaxID=159736 RepID=UPI0030C8C75C
MTPDICFHSLLLFTGDRRLPRPGGRVPGLSPNPGPRRGLLRDDRVDQGDGNFNYAFCRRQRPRDGGVRAPGAEGAVSMRDIILPLESGGVTRVEFVADGAGFQPSSDILPTPHPLPEHVRELLSIAEEFRRQGVQFDDQGRRIN